LPLRQSGRPVNFLQNFFLQSGSTSRCFLTVSPCRHESHKCTYHDRFLLWSRVNKIERFFRTAKTGSEN
jgi:hypothetical protein